MHATRLLSLSIAILAIALGSCGGGGSDTDTPTLECRDGIDNDGDGATDFPDDIGCTSETDESEDSLPVAKCADGRDNDGDGKMDYPADPGCFAPQVDDEADPCPDGEDCPECGDGKDNDGNGKMDYPADPGCTSASDNYEFLQNPVACGAGLKIASLPTTGVIMGTLDSTSTSMVTSPCGGGAGVPALAYELHLTKPKVVEVWTDDPATTADTVIDIRSQMCEMGDSHLACNDDVSSVNPTSKLTVPLSAGNYYIIVSAHDSGSSGMFRLQVKLHNGEGTVCATEGDCGPGLVCRVPLGGSDMVCSKPMCDDGVDDDGMGDGADWPDDPGCTSKTDNDESDDCPGGPNCPECGNDVDDDGDMNTDYPADNTCGAAGDASESCLSSEGVTLITGPMTTGMTTGGTSDLMPACGSSVSSGPDRHYRLDIPAVSTLNLNLTANYDTVSVLLGSTCSGTPISCSGALNMAVTNLAAGTYYFIVDGYDNSDFGTYTINLNGTIANGARCDGPLATSGALVCGPGHACKGPMNNKTCQPALCGDGIDNDGDMKADYPFDPGCTSIADDDETDDCPSGASCPVCGNGLDEDTDMTTDWPNDYGCASAAGGSEVFCMQETDGTALMTTAQVMGTTAAKTNNLNPTCKASTAPDVTYALSLPVPVVTLVIDTIGSSYDSILHIHDANCGPELACDDDAGGSLTSKVTMTNVAPGNYAIVVDGYNVNAGMFKLNVKGTVAPQTDCSSPMFAAGMLVCPMGTTCSGTPAKCQP
ncbi:MAG: hypothetical protein AB7P03_06665 [Kofleriaceae bacterium]